MTIAIGAGSAAAAASVDLQFSKLTGLAGKGLIPVAGSLGNYSFGQPSNGLETSRTYETIHSIATDFRDLTILEMGWSAVAPAPNTYFVKASVIVTTTTGTYSVPLPGPDGNRTARVDPGCFVLLGPISQEFAKDVNGTVKSLRIRRYISVTTLGQTWPTHDYGAAGTTTEAAVDRTDVTTAMPAFAGEFFSWPQAILGIPTSTTRYMNCTVYGDSIAAGAWTNWIGQGINGVVGGQGPVIDLARPVETGIRLLSERPDQSTHRWVQGEFSQNAIWEYFVNDHGGGINTAAVAMARDMTAARRLRARGHRVFLLTATPTNTTGSSGIALNATYESVRVARNNWLRDGAPLDGSGVPSPGAGGSALRAGQLGHPLADPGVPPGPGCTYPGYFDVADAAETARNSGIWAAGMSSDGTHIAASTPNWNALAAKLSGAPLTFAA